MFLDRDGFLWRKLVIFAEWRISGTSRVLLKPSGRLIERDYP